MEGEEEKPPEKPELEKDPSVLAEEEPPPEEEKEPPPEEPNPAAEETKPPPEESLPSNEPSLQQVETSSAERKSVSALKSSEVKSEKSVTNYQAEKATAKLGPSKCAEGGVPGFCASGNFCSTFLNKRSPFIHNPPQPEERRTRIANPRTPREYIINLREDLADFQESHGLPRTRDYSFISLGLALAQETARALCSLFLMFAELFPIVAIVSLLMRFALDKLIEILETPEPVPKVKKSIIFAVEILVIIIPLWILIGTIILPLLSLVLSIFKRMLRIRGRGRRYAPKAKTCSFSGFRLF